MPTNGDLTPWTNQGVMLLNRCLTVEAGKPGSHQDKGWEIVTDAAIKALNNRRNPDGSIKPLVAILWGRKAQTLGPLLTNAYIIASPHPSPMSARYGSSVQNRSPAPTKRSSPQARSLWTGPSRQLDPLQ